MLYLSSRNPEVSSPKLSGVHRGKVFEVRTKVLEGGGWAGRVVGLSGGGSESRVMREGVSVAGKQGRQSE